MASLKIKPEHFELIKAACEAKVQAHPGLESSYRKQGLSAKRFHWDVFHSVSINGEPSNRFVCDVLYKYLNDDHINSALRVVFANGGKRQCP